MSDNVKSFVQRLEKGANILTNDDQDHDGITEEDSVDDVENINIRDEKQVSLALDSALNNINNW